MRHGHQPKHAGEKRPAPPTGGSGVRPPRPSLSPGGQDEGRVYGIIDPDYARVFTQARCAAWANGYALMMHGSFTRDLDVLAVPWAENAAPPENLVPHIELATGLKLIGRPPSKKPHGRLVWTLLFPTFGDPRFVDLSVMPRLVLEQSA